MKIFNIINEINDLEKAWQQSAKVGEIRIHKDGKKYRKMGQTGDANKDWKLVPEGEDNKKESNGVPKKGTYGGNKQSKQSLTETAKNASETALHTAIKESGDQKVREAAHQELDRREKEEKVQEETSKEGDKKENKQGDLDSIEGVEAEIKHLRDIDTGDLDEITKISEDIQKLLKKREELQDKQQSERKVSFEEYKKGFKDLSQSTPKDVNDYYLKETETLKFTLDEESSLNSYKGENYVYFRHYLTDKKDYIDSYGEDEVIEKEIQDTSSFISKNRIEDNLSLNRRVKGSGKKFFQGLKEGDIYEDKSFSSTSLRENGNFGDFNIEILAKKGSNVANIGNVSEYEYLIDKGSKFRVLKTSGTGIIVELL